MEYEYMGSYENYDDDLLLEYRGKDLYEDDDDDDDDDGELNSELNTDGKAHENGNVSCQSDVIFDENEYDDDNLLLSIQKQFGSSQTTTIESQEFNDTCTEEDDDAILEAVSDVPFDGINAFSNNTRYTTDALEKNRFLQKVLAKKLALIQSKLRENADLKKRVRALIEFHKSTKRKQQQYYTISSVGLRNRPTDNPDVATFRCIQKKFYSTCEPKPWSRDEKKALVKGVTQQIQESQMRAAMQMFNNEANRDTSYFDDQIKTMFTGGSVLSPQDIRTSLHVVDWNEVSRIYVSRHSPVECCIQWSNHEDPLISHRDWTKQEDKRLWSIAKEHRLCNWKSIANALGTHRSPAECLIRYQRSLNASIMRSTWTAEEDAQLCAAVELYGDQDWPAIAATLEGRTGPQCWNRWRKTLNPSRKKTGRWDTLEDTRLKLAVSVYGPRMWKIIASHVPGRTEVQCRERWCNVLDPSLTLAEWTKQEDQRLEEAVSNHGQHKWSLVANELKPRTDNQCWRRWKHLHPEQLSSFRKNNKIQKAAMINNFVGRKRERPNIGPSDFIIPEGLFSDDEDSVHRKTKKHRRANCDIKENQINPQVCKFGCDEDPAHRKTKKHRRANCGIQENEINPEVCKLRYDEDPADRKTKKHRRANCDIQENEINPEVCKLRRDEDPAHRKTKKNQRANCNIQENEINPEVCKLRRAARMQKLREARANGEMWTTGFTIVVRVNG